MIAVFLIVVLRISIGWQFLYEGLWKIDKQDSDRPWSAAGYLSSAQGPIKNYYRGMVDDPQDLNWLDHQAVVAQWDDWLLRFKEHYELTENQSKSLDSQLNGRTEFVVTYPYQPSKWRESDGLKKVMKFEEVTVKDSKGNEKTVQQVTLRGGPTGHMLESEKSALLKMAPIISIPKDKTEERQNAINIAFRSSILKLDDLQTRLGYRQRLLAELVLSPEMMGITEPEFRPGKASEYKNRVALIQKMEESADQDFEWDHVAFHRAQLAEVKAETVAVVKGLDRDMKEAARDLLTVEQLEKGHVPPPETEILKVNSQTITALTVLGTLLILGLGTRISAVVGAGMLLSFYMAAPPWPWLNVPEALGPEHALIVNKNLIEAIALLAIAALPTGSWFGIDGLICCTFRKLCSGKCSRSSRKSAAPASQPSPATT